MRMIKDGTAAEGADRSHKRRSRWFQGKFLVLFLAVATILGGWAVVAPQFQQKASAIDDKKDIVWDINGGQKAYKAMIEAVRQRVTGGTVLREGILQTNPNLDTSNANIFAVEVQHSGVASSSNASRVRLIFRARDLFLIGWHIAKPQGDAGGTVFWFKGDDPGYRGSDPLNAAASVQEMAFTGNYTDLERNGRSRVGLTLNGQLMEQAFRDIRESDLRRGLRGTSSAAMIFIMTIAEAARFDPLEQAFAQAFDPNGGRYEITANDAKLMNDWSSISDQLVNNLNNRTPINVAIGDDDPATVDFEHATVAGLATLLAICLVTVL
jgi:hypothetical protein